MHMPTPDSTGDVLIKRVVALVLVGAVCSAVTQALCWYVSEEEEHRLQVSDDLYCCVQAFPPRPSGRRPRQLLALRRPSGMMVQLEEPAGRQLLPSQPPLPRLSTWLRRPQTLRPATRRCCTVHFPKVLSVDRSCWESSGQVCLP